MAKVIGFCGASGAGKTTLALKVAVEIYKSTPDISVLYISGDINVPAMGLLFPNYKKQDIHSLSTVLDNTSITQEAVLNGMMTIPGMRNFGCLGFTAGENKNSFARPSADKIDELFTSMKNLVDYIIVDCSGNSVTDDTDLISRKAISESDILIRVVTPDLKSIAWYASNKNLVRMESEHLYNVVNIVDNDVNLPIEEVCTQFKANAIVIPYCKDVKSQMLEGRVIEKANKGKYNKAIHNLTETILKDEPVQITYDDAGTNAEENFDAAAYEGGILT